MANQTSILPPHIEETIQAISKFQVEHHDQASKLQKIVNRLTARIGQPIFAGVLGIIILCWMMFNIGLKELGYHPLDEPPFFWLQGLVSFMSLYIATLILAAQRWQDELAGYREQLTLELAILSEQKSAKIIELVEALRRDHPEIEMRDDPIATQMATPSDPGIVLEAIKKAQNNPDEAADDKEDGSGAAKEKHDEIRPVRREEMDSQSRTAPDSRKAGGSRT